MKANDDVAEALRRTINLMQGELERSVFTTQMLGVNNPFFSATDTDHLL
jgi:protein transport protein SEC20